MVTARVFTAYNDTREAVPEATYYISNEHRLHVLKRKGNIFFLLEQGIWIPFFESFKGDEEVTEIMASALFGEEVHIGLIDGFSGAASESIDYGS